MSTTVTKLANANQAVSETTAWSNPTNAYSSTDADASATNTVGKNNTNTRSWGFPAFTTSDVPDNATIVSVVLRYRYASSTTGVTGGTLDIQGDLSGSAFGSTNSETQTVTFTTNTLNITSGVTKTNLRSANAVRARVSAIKGNTNSALTWSLDYVQLEVTYDYPVLAQSSFRFYADGTESGSTALANQDTNYSTSLSSDENIALRLRIQESVGVAGLSTDNYELYVSKNSGSYLPIRSLIDSYATSNQNAEYALGFGSGGTLVDEVGQSFDAGSSNHRLVKISVWGRRVGSPTGPFNAQLYAHSGTYGTSSLPTGSALGVSANTTVDALSTSFHLEEFAFSGSNRVTLAASTKYVWNLTQSFTFNNSSNYFGVGVDNSSPTHGGNIYWRQGGTRSAFSDDACFFVYGDLPEVGGYNSSNFAEDDATTNRLGSGSGSFTAGKISEDTEINSYQVVANNYTELLFSIELISANLTNGDTLDFKVYKNDSVIDTYNVVPRVTIGTPAAPSVKNLGLLGVG